MIKAGAVKVDGRVVKKPGLKVSEHVSLEVGNDPISYVSRGGLKLERALQVFNIKIEGAIVVDSGASTGGFTECSLRHGADKVYAVDVGHTQLAEPLRNSRRVVVMEDTNARYLTSQDFAEEVNVVTIDVSFISLSKLFAPISNIIKPCGDIVALIKPQFEAGPGL